MTPVDLVRINLGLVAPPTPPKRRKTRGLDDEEIHPESPSGADEKSDEEVDADLMAVLRQADSGLVAGRMAVKVDCSPHRVPARLAAMERQGRVVSVVLAGGRWVRKRWYVQGSPWIAIEKQVQPKRSVAAIDREVFLGMREHPETWETAHGWGRLLEMKDKSVRGALPRLQASGRVQMRMGEPRAGGQTRALWAVSEAAGLTLPATALDETLAWLRRVGIGTAGMLADDVGLSNSAARSRLLQLVHHGLARSWFGPNRTPGTGRQPRMYQAIDEEVQK